MSPLVVGSLVAVAVSLVTLAVLIVRWPTSAVHVVLRNGARRTVRSGRVSMSRSRSPQTSARAAKGKERASERTLLTSLLRRYRAVGIEPPTRLTVIVVSAVTCLAAVVLTTLAGWSIISAAVVALVAWLGVMYLDYSRRRAKRKVAFESELPVFLMTLSSSLKAGLTLDQAMAELTTDTATVLGSEFGQARREVALGKSWQDALAPIAERMGSVDLRNLIDGLSLAQDTGSSLTGILEALAESCLERSQLKREIKTLTAEGMMSAYVIIALPFIIFLFLLLTQPSYVAVLWQPGLGMGMGIGAVVLIALGWTWLKRTIAAGSR